MHRRTHGHIFDRISSRGVSGFRPPLKKDNERYALIRK